MPQFSIGAWLALAAVVGAAYALGWWSGSRLPTRTRPDTSPDLARPETPRRAAARPGTAGSETARPGVAETGRPGAADPDTVRVGAARPAAAPKTHTPPAPAAPTRAEALSSGPTPSAPRPDRATLGRYRIERQIGHGSMGIVYLGHDPQIGRAVALKTMALGREFHGAELEAARTRFFREAEMAGRLQHPDIVTIFDANEEQGLAYIAMEYLKGHDLLRYTVPSQLLPVPQVLDIVARVADALAHAHRQGVVHRDVKPANVMVDLQSGVVKVTDFGIARVADASRTRTGLVLGTPSFMSPEQMAGRRVDGRTDLYSLGVMLFQLLTGVLPHRSESIGKLMHQIANEAAPDIRSERPELPEALANVVALALEKRPEVRYAEGGQMAADLRAVALLWELSLTPDADVPPAAPVASTPAVPGSETDPAPGHPADGFEATQELARNDPRHNSAT